MPKQKKIKLLTKTTVMLPVVLLENAQAVTGEGITKTHKIASTGEWTRGYMSTVFPLLESVSLVGERSSYLTRQWAEDLMRLEDLKKHGILSR